MATIFSHSLVGYALHKVSPLPQTQKLRLWMCLLPILPDLDYLGFSYGVRYGDLWGHRGLTHSILFAVSIAAMTGLAVKESHYLKVFFFFFLAILSHGLLDALTNGGLGVAFFSPFDPSRYFFGWRPVRVSPLGLGFFSIRGVHVMISEIFWLWIPIIAILLFRKVMTKKLKA